MSAQHGSSHHFVHWTLHYLHQAYINLQSTSCGKKSKLAMKCWGLLYVSWFQQNPLQMNVVVFQQSTSLRSHTKDQEKSKCRTLRCKFIASQNKSLVMIKQGWSYNELRARLKKKWHSGFPHKEFPMKRWLVIPQAYYSFPEEILYKAELIWHLKMSTTQHTHNVLWTA